MFFKQKKIIIHNESPTNLKKSISITDIEYIEKQLHLIDLTEEDLLHIRTFQPIIQDSIDEIINIFYDRILKIDDLKQIIETKTTVEKLKKVVGNYLVLMFDGNINKEIIDKKRHIAKIHFKLGIEPKWYMGTFQQIQTVIYNKLLQAPNISMPPEKIAVVLSKFINFELQIVLEEYEYQNRLLIEQRANAVKEELKDKISFITTKFLQLTQKSTENMQAVQQTTEKLNATIQSNLGIVQLVESTANEGGQLLHHISKESNVIQQEVTDVSNVTEQLVDASKEIQSILSIVQNIANETNLLALNASIEAAHAGQFGKGFNIVAQEVRKLAEKSKQSVADIEQLLKQANELTMRVNSAVMQVQQSMNSNVETSNNAQERFTNIIDNVAQNKQLTTLVNNNVELLGGFIRAIDDEITYVAQIAQELYVTTESL